MKVKLSGGRFSGEEMNVSDSLSVVSCPLISLRHDRAVPISGANTKHHSWDRDALSISYIDYYKTDMVADDGTVIFVPKEEAFKYV